MHAFVEFPELSRLIVSAEQLLSAESTIKIVLPLSFIREKEVWLFCVVTILKETVRKTRVSGIVKGSFVTGQGLVRFIS